MSHEKQIQSIIGRRERALEGTEVFSERQRIMIKYWNLLKSYEVPTRANGRSAYPESLDVNTANTPSSLEDTTAELSSFPNLDYHPRKEQLHQDGAQKKTS